VSFYRHHKRLVRFAAALLLYSGAVVVWFHAIVAHPESRMACCGPDGTGSIRDLWLASHLHESPWTLAFDPLNGVPGGTARAPATTIANGGLQTLVVWSSRHAIGLVGGWNLFALIGLLGTAMATFALLEWLGCAFVASLFGGYVFGFSPYAIERIHAGHLGLMQNWTLVLAAAAMIHVGAKRTYGSAVVAGLVTALAFYVSAYEGLFAGLVVAAYYIAELARRSGREVRIRTVALASLSLLVTIASLLPVAFLYRREHQAASIGISHKAGDLYAFAAKVPSYFLPSPANPLFHWLRGIHSRDLFEQSIFFGYTTLALAVFAYVLARRRDLWLRSFQDRWYTAIAMAVLAPLAFVLSLPPSYHVSGVPVPTPSVMLALMTTFWRAYGRFGVVVGFALTLLAALALTSLSRRRGAFFKVLPVLALLVAFLELLPGTTNAFDTRASAAPGWVTWLARQPQGTVATYPMSRGFGPANELAQHAFFWQTVDSDPLFVRFGQTDRQFSSRNESIRLLAFDLGSSLAPRVLSTMGVRYVLVDPATYRAQGEKVPALDRKRFTWLTSSEGLSIYAVHARRVDIGAMLHTHVETLRALRGLPPLRPRPPAQ
jgi:hypothetical protein